MAEQTGISWCDSTISFWWGCEKVSSGCKFCYADAMSSRRLGEDIWGRGKPRKIVKSAPSLARKLNAKARSSGKPHLVFVNSMSDFFEEDHGQPIINHLGEEKRVSLTEVRRTAFEIMDECEHLTFLLLTKRPENIRKYWPVATTNLSVLSRTGMSENYRENVWLGASAEDQSCAEYRIPKLLGCGDLSPLLWLSAEPLLGSLDLRDYLKQPWMPDYIVKPHSNPISHIKVRGLDWVVAGCESGSHRRPAEQAWFESIRAQCKSAGVPFFMKQMELDGDVCHDVAKFPEGLNVQEFPGV